jgi:hypothetical protein
MRVISTFEATNSNLVLETNSGSTTIPTFSAGSSGSNVSEAIRIDVNGSARFLAFVDPPDAAIDGIRLDGGSVGTKAVHDTATLGVSTVTSRPDDDSVASLSDSRGLVVEPAKTFQEFGARISNNTSGATRARLFDYSKNSFVASKNISGLSGGDAFTFQTTVSPGTDYGIEIDANGSSYTLGFANSTTSYPFTGGDFDILAVSSNGSQNTGSGAQGVNDIGDVGL